MPVLPLVGSTIVPPGFSLPSRSAASMMRDAMRSLLDPPGLKYSIFASTVAVMPSVTEFSLTRGVSPTRSSTVSAYFMLSSLPAGRGVRYGVPVARASRWPCAAGARSLSLARVGDREELHGVAARRRRSA